MKDYVEISPSLFYKTEWLIDLYVNNEYIGSNYISDPFTGDDLIEAKKRITTLSLLISYPMKGPSK